MIKKPVCVVLRPVKKGRRIEVRISHVQGAKIMKIHELHEFIRIYTNGIARINNTDYTNVSNFHECSVDQMSNFRLTEQSICVIRLNL